MPEELNSQPVSPKDPSVFLQEATLHIKVLADQNLDLVTLLYFFIYIYYLLF